ncbi:pentatricopeptide repeat-containing protein [Skeletonema marinoi]|uniref:Pentatricopeptide repeat-containing protein n=2 Tax=Skeletonema marinoi TaxID=267567 RepID=A0AAD8YED4_9STRA|nr:pentatricopeptide repeat-containing protein [Skeletonema marinoi]
MMGAISSLHCLDVTNRFISTDSAADSFFRNKRRSRNTSKHPRHRNSSADKSSSMQPSKDISETTRRLLSMNSSLTQHGYALRDFEQILINAREDESLLQKLQISPADTRTMLLIPPQLLNDVHEAVVHYSKIDSLVEIDIPVHNQLEAADNKIMENEIGMNTIKKKVPSTMVCALLLELIGIPQYYSHISTPTSTDSPPIMTVHSSQVDKMIECSLLTTAALSNTCRVGRNSLIGYDFNSQNINNAHSATKTAAALAEEIWRNLPRPPIRIGRIGFIGEQEYNPLMEYVSALREVADEGNADGDFVNEQDTISDVDDFDYIDDPSVVPTTLSVGNNVVPWSPKDQRRYDQTLMMFNSVLDAYAKLGSSASGTRPEIRREMVMNCERLLLEVVAREKTNISPETILQHIQPDGISFNTVMKAWAGMSPKQRGNSEDEYAKTISSATAERTEGILEMMHEYYEKERVLEERGGSSIALGVLSTAPNSIPVTPNTASYNIALNAWSKSSDPDSAIKALELFKRMVQRCNNACIAREALVIDSAEVAHGTNPRVFNAIPDSRTFTALLSALNHTSSTFNEACDLVLSIFVVMKEWDDQLRWCSDIKLDFIKTSGNKFWEEHYECCNQIDKIIEEMSESVSPNAITRGFGINAWAACAMQAQSDKSHVEQCAEKASVHLYHLLSDYTKFESEKSVKINAINDVINLYGKASQPIKAVEVFETAKEKQLYNLQSLAVIVDALAKNSYMDISYVDKAKQYLLEFERDKMRMSPSLVFPDMKYTKMYNSVISGYLNCNQKDKGLAQAHQDYLFRFFCNGKKVNLDILNVNGINLKDLNLNVYTTSGTVEGAEKATELLHQLERMNASGEISFKPERFLHNYNNQHRKGVEALSPNNASFSLCIKSWCRSNRPDAPERAEQILRRKEVFAKEQSNVYIIAPDYNQVSQSGGMPKSMVLTVPAGCSKKWIKITEALLN